MKINVNNFIIKNLIFILVFLMMFSATENMKIKMGITFLLLIFCGFYILANIRVLNVHRGVLIWFMIFIFAGVFYTCLSIINMNKQPTNFFNVYVVGPIIYFMFIISIKKEHLKFINKVVIIALLAILGYNILFALVINRLLLLNAESGFRYVQANYGGLDLGFIKITSQNISWLLFCIPFFLAKFMLLGERRNTFLVVIVLLGGGLNAILTARTAYILGIAITPAIVIIGAIFTKTKLNILHIFQGLFIITFLIVVSEMVGVIDFELILQKVLKSFSSDAVINQYGVVDNGGNIRYEQLRDLLYTWMHRPLLGWGDAASSLNVVRSDTSAGSYELTFVALLMQRGIVGFSLFWAQIAWVYFKGIRIIKQRGTLSELMFCTLAGYTVFLLANATNPYMYSFDRLFILFYPLLLINYNELFVKQRTNYELEYGSMETQI